MAHLLPSGWGLWFLALETVTVIHFSCSARRGRFSLPDRGVSATGRDFAQGLLATLIHTLFEVIYFSRITYSYSHSETSLLLCLLGQSLAKFSCYSDAGPSAFPPWVSLSPSIKWNNGSCSGALPPFLAPSWSHIHGALTFCRHWARHQEL